MVGLVERTQNEELRNVTIVCGREIVIAIRVYYAPPYQQLNLFQSNVPLHIETSF